MGEGRFGNAALGERKGRSKMAGTWQDQDQGMRLDLADIATNRLERKAAKSPYIHTWADISPCKKYRYALTREWRGTHKHENWRWLTEDDGSICVDGAGSPLGEPKACVFVMLNPSTADGTKDDPTIRRCVAFAKREKFEKLIVVNLFAFRATKPKIILDMNHDQDPVGVRNQDAFNNAINQAGLIICAWGVHGVHLDQDETARGWLGDNLPHHALGTTKEGFPRHPLYVKSDARLMVLP